MSPRLRAALNNQMMKSRPCFPHFLLALACSFSTAIAEDAPAPAAPAAPLQLQFGGAVVLPAAVAPDAKTPPAKKEPRPGWLGFVLDAAVVAEDAGAQEKKEEGVGVLSVVGDSPAEKAGLKAGDRVLTFEEKKAKDHVQLREMIRAAQPEQKVQLTVRREGKDIVLKATLGAAPDEALAGQIIGGPGLVGNIDDAEGRPNVRAAVPGVVIFRNPVSGFVVGGMTGTAAAGGSAKAPANDQDTVTLRDGNVFTGKIHGITAEKGVQLQRAGLSDLELIQEEITALTFAERPAAKETAPKEAAPKETAVPKAAALLPTVVVQMRDGSVLHGDALTMEQGALRLTLPAGPGETEGKRLEIPREHAQTVAISEGDAPRIYEGPTGLTGWSSGRSTSSQWDYKDGFLRCLAYGPIARDFGHLPDPLDLSFDVNYPPQAQHFSLRIFATDASRSGVGSLSLQFSPTQIRGTHYDGQRSNQYNTNPQPNGQLNAVAQAGDKAETIRYRVLVDRVNGRALIYVNGEQRADWKLSTVKSDDLAKCGGAISITPNISMVGTAFKVGRVRVLPWDGKEPPPGAGPAEEEGDLLLTGDGKAVAGTIDRITGVEVVLANSGTKMRRDKTLFIRFAPAAAAKELAPATATVRLKNGSEVSAKQVTSNGDTLTLTTRSGPEVTVPLGALLELNFFPRPGQPEVTVKNLDVLTLTDGTQFTGRAVLPLAGKGVSWKISASKTPLEFPTEKIAGVVFRSTEGGRKSAPLKGDNALKLANGDWLPGEVVSLDGKELVLKTDLAPALKFPVSELRALYLDRGVVGALSDGATGPDSWANGWTPGRGANGMIATGVVFGGTAAKSARPWTYHDGSYLAAGPRTSQQMLSKRWAGYEGPYAIHFEVTSPAQGRSFSAQIYNSKEEQTFSITSSGPRLYVYYNGPRAGLAAGPRKNFRIDLKTAAEGGTVRVALVLDQPAKTFRVMLDGKEVGKMAFKADEAKEALEAGGFSLSGPMSYSSISTKESDRGRICNIWLAPWSDTPAVADAAAEKEKPAADPEPKKEPASGAEKTAALKTAAHVFLANGDEFAGTIEKLTADLLTVNSEVGPLEVPGKQIAWLRFPGPERPAADHFPRLRFHDRGLLSVNDLHITDGRVQCQTLDGQPLDFPLNVVKELAWRPLDAK